MLKGLLYVGLYYVAITVLGAISIFSETRSRALYALMTPFGAFYLGTVGIGVPERHLLAEVVVGLAIQSALIWTILAGIRARLTNQ